MKVKNLYRDVTKKEPIRTISVHMDLFLVVKHLSPYYIEPSPTPALRCHSRRSIMAVLGDELSRLGESIILVLHDEATLLPVAQEDGKLRLGAMNHTDILNLSLVKGIVNEEQKIAHTG